LRVGLGLSGAVAAAVTMPFDVAKTTIQCGTKKGSMASALVWIYQEKGTKGLFAGLVSLPYLNSPNLPCYSPDSTSDSSCR